MHVNFITIPMIKTIIETKSVEETKASFARMETETKKYLNHLEKNRLKAKASDG